MPKSTWMFAGVLSALVLLAVGWLQIRESSRAEAEARLHAEELAATAAAASATNAVLAGQLEAARALVTELQTAIEQATQAKSSLEAEFRAALDSKEVTISELQGRLTVNILDRVLFDSGEAVVKPEGEAVLADSRPRCCAGDLRSGSAGAPAICQAVLAQEARQQTAPENRRCGQG